MNDIATLALPATTLCRLLQYVGAHPAEASAGELAAIAIEEWLERAKAGKALRASCHGYQWKTVFLPEGTQLRAWNRNGYAYAEVIGDAIIFQGDSVSPHEFICRCKGISRSAWTEVALLLPDERCWRQADVLRRGMAPRPACHASPAPAPTTASTSLPSAESPPLPLSASASCAQKSGHQRLPRVLPIPTQARHQPGAEALATADWTMALPSNRRQGYRRQEDLLLD